MADPGFIAKGNTGPFFIGHDRAEVEHESGSKAAPVHNVTQDQIDLLLRYGVDVVMVDQYMKTERAATND